MLSCFSNSNSPIHFLQQGTIEKAFLTCHAPEHTRNKWGNSWIQKLYIAYTGTANHWQIVRSFAGRNWFRVCNVLAKTWGPLIPILLLSQWTNVIVKDLKTYFINLSATTWCLPVLCTWSSSSFFSLHLLIENAVNVQPGNGVLRYLNDSIAPWILTTRSWLVEVPSQYELIMSLSLSFPFFPRDFFAQEISTPGWRLWRPLKLAWVAGWGRVRVEATKDQILNFHEELEVSSSVCRDPWVGLAITPWCYLSAGWERDQMFLWRQKSYIIYLSYLIFSSW